jgi:hypothetical protein
MSKSLYHAGMTVNDGHVSCTIFILSEKHAQRLELAQSHFHRPSDDRVACLHGTNMMAVDAPIFPYYEIVFGFVKAELHVNVHDSRCVADGLYMSYTNHVSVKELKILCDKCMWFPPPFCWYVTICGQGVPSISFATL